MVYFLLVADNVCMPFIKITILKAFETLESGMCDIIKIGFKKGDAMRSEIQ